MRLRRGPEPGANLPGVAPRFVHADVRFTCSQCGDCCRTFDVPLVQGEAERLESLAWEGSGPGAQVTTPIRVAGLAGRRQLARRRDGACVFLGERSQCLVHERFGELAKPLMCRLYPFAFYPLGDRVGVDVSFACRAVAAGEGAPLEARLPEWSRLHAELALQGSEQQVLLTHEHALPPALAWEIEEQILEILAPGTQPLFDRVRAVLQFVKLATTGDPTTEAAATMRRVLARGIPKQIAAAPHEGTMDKTQRNVFYQWLYVALNPAPPGFEHLGADLQERGKRAIGKAGDRFRARRGKPTVEGREIEASFADVQAVDASALREGSLPLERFLQAKVLGQKLLKAASEELPLVEAVPKLLLLYPMAIWSAKAQAAIRGASVVAEGDVRTSLRLLDRTYGAVATSLLPRVQAEAFEWVMLDTELVECAAAELLQAGP